MEEQVNMDDFQQEENESIKNSKITSIDKPGFSFKKWLAGIIVFGIGKFMTDAIWQRYLFLYLLLVCPIGSWHLLKFIYKIFIKIYFPYYG